MNSVVLIGRLTKDPEVRYTQGAEPMAVARFTLAVDRRGKDEADFISCVAFKKAAEFYEKYITKGTKVAVLGHIQMGSYVNREGTKIHTTDVVVDQTEFAQGKQDTPSKKKDDHTSPTDGFMSIPDDLGDAGLPFN